LSQGGQRHGPCRPAALHVSRPNLTAALYAWQSAGKESIFPPIVDGCILSFMQSEQPQSRAIGRGAQTSPGNRFERVHLQADLEQVACDDELLAESRRVPTVFLPNDTRRIITSNDSPDIPFRYSINPYR